MSRARIDVQVYHSKTEIEYRATFTDRSQRRQSLAFVNIENLRSWIEKLPEREYRHAVFIKIEARAVTSWESVLDGAFDADSKLSADEALMVIAGPKIVERAEDL